MEVHIMEFLKCKKFASEISLKVDSTTDALIFRIFKECICSGVSFEYSYPWLLT